MGTPDPGTSGSARPSRPAFTGLVVHRDLKHRYSLLVPDGWHRFELEGEAGSLYAPDPEDVHTSLSLSARDLGTAVEPGDLESLRSGFVGGLRQVPGSEIEGVEAEAVGRLITMEARQRFREGAETRRRWVRLAYQGRTQVRLVAQGASPERFEQYESMFYQAMRTFRFADWWAEVTGQSWLETPFQEDPG
jgi:hypothetical protein